MRTDMRLRDEYRASLKSVAVEEPIDLLLHRPLAFLVAKAAKPTPITPNQLTVLSMVLGLVSGVVMTAGTQSAALWGAALLVGSQVVDCSDGMLARMRKAGSELGRMLDGMADSVTLGFAVIGALTQLIGRMHAKPAEVFVVLLLGLATIYTSSLHTSAYDHYKNLFLRVTVPDNHEGEDVEHAEARWEAAKARGMGPVLRAVFPVYVNYLKGQRRMIAWFDPAAHVRLEDLPAYSDERARAFSAQMLPAMRLWRALFGVGSLVFGLAFFVAIGHVEIFIAFRLVLLNAIFFGVLMPLQRRASEAALAALGTRPLPPEDPLRPRGNTATPPPVSP